MEYDVQVVFLYVFLSSCSGQGTISLELLEQVPQLDTIIVPISGLFYHILVSTHVFGPALFLLLFFW